MKIHAFILLIFLNLSLVSGCAVTKLTSDVDPQAKLDALNIFYVVRQPKDRRGIEKMISAELKKYGKESSYGDNLRPPVKVDAVVTYVDKWMWDLTNYMLELTIEFRDPDTDYKLATGKSYRSSLARKSPDGMVEEVVQKILIQPETKSGPL